MWNFFLCYCNLNLCYNKMLLQQNTKYLYKFDTNSTLNLKLWIEMTQLKIKDSELLPSPLYFVNELRKSEEDHPWPTWLLELFSKHYWLKFYLGQGNNCSDMHPVVLNVLKGSSIWQYNLIFSSYTLLLLNLHLDQPLHSWVLIATLGNSARSEIITKTEYQIENYIHLWPKQI